MSYAIKFFSIDEFKKLINTNLLHIQRGSKGRYYATNDNFIRVAAVSDRAVQALQQGKSVIVLEMWDTKDTWYLIVPMDN